LENSWGRGRGEFQIDVKRKKGAGRCCHDISGSFQGRLAEHAARARYLEERGWQVLRVWNADVFTGWNAVCDTILMALEKRT
jgi:hypothetical protein